MEQIDALKELIYTTKDRDDIINQKEDLKIKLTLVKLLEKEFRQHSITLCINSFEEFSYLSTSIYYCSLHNHLHVFLLGLSKYAAEATIGIWTPTTKYDFEIIARKIVDDNSSSA